MLPTVSTDMSVQGAACSFLSSKTFHSSFVFLNPFRQVSHWRKAVGKCVYYSLLCLISVILAGVKYELVATVCIKGKKLVDPIYIRANAQVDI